MWIVPRSLTSLFTGASSAARTKILNNLETKGRVPYLFQYKNISLPQKYFVIRIYDTMGYFAFIDQSAQLSTNLRSDGSDFTHQVVHNWLERDLIFQRNGQTTSPRQGIPVIILAFSSQLGLKGHTSPVIVASSGKLNSLSSAAS